MQLIIKQFLECLTKICHNAKQGTHIDGNLLKK